MFGKKDDKPSVIVNTNGEGGGYVDLEKSKPKQTFVEIVKGSTVGFLAGIIPASIAATMAGLKGSHFNPNAQDPTNILRPGRHSIRNANLAFAAVSTIATAIGGLVSGLNAKNHNKWADEVNSRALQEKAQSQQSQSK